MAYGFNPEGGSRNFNFSSRATHSGLGGRLRIARGTRRAGDGFFLRAESYYNVATYIDELELTHRYGGKSLHDQSHGESFMSLMLQRMKGHGVYILDEPEAALSPARQMAFLVRMDELVKANSQFIIATHSPIIMAYPEANIHVLSDEGMALTEYRKTDHYLITKRFMEGPAGMVDYLLRD